MNETSDMDDPVPSSVYDVVAKELIQKGCGDIEIYKVYEAISEAWPK